MRNFLHTSFPFVHQHDSMQCGVACLAMICQHLGKNYTSTDLSPYCHPTREGVSMLGIAEAAKAIGLHTMAGKITMQQLQAAPLPCIIHWNQNHFVVLYKVAENHFYLADPAIGHVKYALDEFERYWTTTPEKGVGKGVAMFFEVTALFGTIDVHKNRKSSSLQLIFTYLRRYKSYFFQIAVGIALGCLFQLLMPLLTQSIVDKGIRYKDISLIWLILAGQLMLVAGRTAIEFIRSWLVLRISMRINISLISGFILKMLRLPMFFFDTQKLGDLLQRINDHSRIQRFLTTQALSALFSMLSIVVLGTMLWIYSGLVFLVFLASGMLYLLWMVFFLQKRRIIDYEYFARHTESNNCTYQLLTTIQEIKLQDCGRRRKMEWEKTQVALFETNVKSLRLQQMMETGGLLINESKNTLITVLSATAVIKGELTLGMMLAIQNIAGQLNNPVAQMASLLYSIQDISISMERIDAVKQAKDEDEGRLEKRFSDPSKGIVFRNVGFKYDPHSPRWTLRDIDVCMAYGKVTAVVGASGSGKTTLLKLMLGFYPITKGELEIGGKPITQLNMAWWRGKCGVVMQESVIFSDTIARNIAMDDGDTDLERLHTAIETACIADFIDQLPLGLNTIIGSDGLGLSQGQKQRILIARAVYRRPEFIFFDEATNSLDANNETRISQHLKHFFKGKTVVIAAHRLSTVRDADNIVVLYKGRIAECGTHQALIRQKGRYYDLVSKQMNIEQSF